MALFKGYHSIFRYLSIIGAIFAIIQAGICIILAIIGIFCYFIKPNIYPSRPVGYAFKCIYFTGTAGEYNHFIYPIVFHLIMWLAIIIYIVWIYFSVQLLKVFVKWNDNAQININTARWIYTTVAVCIFDLIIFLLFFIEFLIIIHDRELKEQMGNETFYVEHQDEYAYLNEYITNLNTIAKLKETQEYLERLKSSKGNQSKSKNPFVKNQMNELDRDNFYVGYDSNIKPWPPTLNATTNRNKIYGIWSWFAAPPAITMTAVMKSYVGWLANVIIVTVVYNLNIGREDQITILTAPKL